MTGLRMTALGFLGLVQTIDSAQDAADAIWNSFSVIEKTIGGFDDTDYQHLRAFLSNLYAAGYVVQKYDDASQITPPSAAQINALVQENNHGVYAQNEVAQAVKNVMYIVGKGFTITRAGAAAMTTNYPTGSASDMGPPAPARGKSSGVSGWAIAGAAALAGGAWFLWKHKFGRKRR